MSKLKVKDLPVTLLNTLSVFGATMAGVVPSSGSTADSEPPKLTKRPWRERRAVRRAKRDQPSYVLVDFWTEYEVKVFWKPFYFAPPLPDRASRLLNDAE